MDAAATCDGVRRTGNASAVTVGAWKGPQVVAAPDFDLRPHFRAETLGMAMGVIIDVRSWPPAHRARAAARRITRAGMRLLMRVIRRLPHGDHVERHHPTARELFRSGRALEGAGQESTAIDAYRAAIERDPTRPHWHFRLGHTLERSRDWAPAASAYERALALDDSRTVWLERHAAALRRTHDTEGLQRAVDALVEREPDMPPLERKLLSADPRRFDARRQILRFVTDHIHEIREVAAVPLQASPEPLDRVWFYWGQGVDQAPAVVRRCHDELLGHHGRDHVVVLDDSTVGHYSQLPGYVHDRIGDNRIKYSDALRLDLLTRHGGIWLDATGLLRRDVTGLLPELVPSGFFALRYRRARMASWLLAAAPGDRTAATLRAAQLVYWRHRDAPTDYFVLHHLFEALVHLDPDVQAAVEAMPWVRAHTASTFAHVMFEPYEPQRFRRLLDATFVHKLSYKTPAGPDLRGTMLEHLLEQDATVTSRGHRPSPGRRDAVPGVDRCARLIRSASDTVARSPQVVADGRSPTGPVSPGA